MVEDFSPCETQSPSEQVSISYFCLLGKRMCLGEQLARTELFIFITSLLQKFTFRSPANEKLSLKFRESLANSPVSYRLCAVPRAWSCLEGEGKESGKNGPVPHPRAGRLLRSEGAASSASRTGPRNWTQRKLDPNTSFTVSSGASGKSVVSDLIFIWEI